MLSLQRASVGDLLRAVILADLVGELFDIIEGLNVNVAKITINTKDNTVKEVNIDLGDDLEVDFEGVQSSTGSKL